MATCELWTHDNKVITRGDDSAWTWAHGDKTSSFDDDNRIRNDGKKVFRWFLLIQFYNWKHIDNVNMKIFKKTEILMVNWYP
jgi:hypothetical protein